MRRIFAATAVMGSASVVAALVGLVNSKILALYVGPAGLGVLAQLVNFNVLVIGLASLGLGDGIIKYVSLWDTEGDWERLRSFLASVLVLLLAVSLLLVVALSLFAESISTFLFSSAEYAGLVWLIALSLPFSVLSVVLRSAVNGYRRVRYLALTSILPALSILLLSWPLVSMFGLTGAVINVVISTILTLVVSLVYFVKSAGAAFATSIVREGRFRSGLLLIVAGFGLASLVGGFAGNQVLIWARRLVIDELGLDANGIYSVVNALSYQTINLALISLGSYSYARMSSMRDREEIVREVNYTLRVVSMLGVVLLFVLSVFRGLVVPLLFSSAFVAASTLIPLQSVGDYLKIMMWSLNLPQLPMGRTRAWLLYWLLWCGMFVGFCYLLIPPFGLFGVVYAHVISHAVGVVLLYLDQRRTLNLSITPANRRLVASSLIMLLSVVFLNGGQVWLYPLFAVELAIWAAANVTRAERLAAIRTVGGALQRVRS